MLKIIKAENGAERELLLHMRSRSAEIGKDISSAVRTILESVRKDGIEAVEQFSLRFDGAPPREIGAEELDAAYRAAPQSLIDALEEAAQSIREYNEMLLQQTKEWQNSAGGTVGRIVRGIDRVGLYVPGGTAAYPSSVLMNAVPAKVAGVSELVMVTPPTGNLNQAVLAAAKIAGVDRVIGVGGAQAIGALAYGAGFIPRVDKICGPGNAYVAEAKRLVYGDVDIDMIAGPSEVLILADETANAEYVAADLLSQAEHDVLASAILITTSEALAQAVDREIVRQTEGLSRKEIIAQSLQNFGAAVVCTDMETCAALANDIAPEHLEICTAHPRDVLPLIRHAGAVFLGDYSPEPLGDYIAGPDHVLPTSGTARFFSPLSVDSFLKTMSVIEYSRAALERQSASIIEMAESEHLTAHANAIAVRFH